MSRDSATIHRRRRGDPFARIPKSMLSDESLSWKAKGLLCYLLGKPDDWKACVSDISKRSSDGPSAVRSGLMELRIAGYAQLQRIVRSGKTVSWRIDVSDDPIFLASNGQVEVVKSFDFPDVENPHVENRHTTKKEGTENESTKTLASQVEPTPSGRSLFSSVSSRGFPSPDGGRLPSEAFKSVEPRSHAAKGGAQTEGDFFCGVGRDGEL